MTMATPPMTMVVSAPKTQAASRSVAAAASASLEAKSPVSVMSSAGILTWRGHGVHAVLRPVAPSAPESGRRAAMTGDAATKREEEKPQHEHEDHANPEDSDVPYPPPDHCLVELAPTKGERR